MAITQTLSEWPCAQRWNDFPDAVKRKSADVIFDSVAR
jgi:hypothetical protein